MKITTNNVPRDVIDGFELTAKEREEFDYINWDKIEAGEDSASFFRYKGELYDLGDFLYISSNQFPGWNAFSCDTYFSGLLIKYASLDNCDQVIVGRYCA